MKVWLRVIIPRWIVTPGHISTLKCDRGSWFHVELWPGSKISRGIMTTGRDSTLNCDTGSWLHVELWPKLNCNLGLGSQFYVEFWPRVIIQRRILTRGHNSTWNSDPSTYLLPVELRLKKVSKIKQRDQNSTAKEGHNSTKNPLKIDPRVGIQLGGQNFILHR